MMEFLSTASSFRAIWGILSICLCDCCNLAHLYRSLFKKRLLVRGIGQSLLYRHHVGRWEDQSVGLLGAIYLCWEILLLLFYNALSKKQGWQVGLLTQLAFYPSFRLSLSRCSQLSMEHSLCLGFWEFLYLTFRSVGIIIELRDGVIKDFTLWEFLRFLLFMPTFSSVQSIALSVLMKIIRPFLSGMS